MYICKLIIFLGFSYGSQGSCNAGALIAVSDELTPLFRDIFPDSEIAKQFASR